MSRCFPYPPPGYAGKSTSNEALILSIKQERERTKSEKKKDRRREKKEKKRDEKANGTLCVEKKKFADEKLHLADKYGESSYDHMEKSNLTEEHGRPCCSSDSTENSGKRKRQSLPPTSNNTRNHGTIIRIRLSTQKREDTPTTSSNNAALCSTSGRVDCLSQKAKAHVKSLSPSLHIPPPSTSNATLELVTASSKEAPPCPGKGIDTGSTSKGEVKLPKALRRYRALFENWAPPPLECETTVEDEDWLFASKREVTQPAKRMKCCTGEVPSCGSHSLQPQAHFLNDADIYALPFTVPF